MYMDYRIGSLKILVLLGNLGRNKLHFEPLLYVIFVGEHPCDGSNFVLLHFNIKIVLHRA